MEEKKLTGYPSVDRPWLKYYSEEAINAPLPEMTMYQYILENNKDRLSNTALEYYGTKITYRQLFDRIQKVASSLWAVGIRAGDVVTVMSMHTPETIYAIYGLNYIGAIANIVYMTLSEKEILDTLQNTSSKLFLVMDVVVKRINRIKDKIHCPIVVVGVSDSMPLPMKLGYNIKLKPPKHGFLSWKTFLASANAPVLICNNHDSPAVIVYTSGTTGQPKGVVLSSDSFNAIVAQIIWTDRNDKEKDTVLHFLPIFFAFGLSMLHRCLSMGMSIHLFMSIDGDAIAKEYQRSKPNRLIAGPVILDAFMRHVRGNMNYCIELTGGGAAIAPEKEKEINTFLEQHGSKSKYLNGYGMSEFCSAVTTNQHSAHKEGSLGIPFVLSVPQIRDLKTNNELKYGEEGEICFSTPSMMLGYYKNDAATNEVIDKDERGIRFLHTGDLGYIDEDGFLYIVGRIKRIYTTKTSDGVVYKLFCQRIEDVFSGNSYVELCASIAVPDSQKLNVAVLFVKTKDNLDVKKERIIQDLKEYSRNELPEHMQPARIVIIDSMPMTQNGKIDYRRLEAMAENGY